jgi:hypothetical protein
MKQLTNDEQICNVLLAAWLWAETPPELVVPGLNLWKCGTQACFGGHLTTWPEFQAMGVVNAGSEPYMQGVSVFHDSLPLSDYLFGDLELFFGRMPLERTWGTDHEVVTRRLEHALEKLLLRSTNKL